MRKFTNKTKGWIIMTLLELTNALDIDIEALRQEYNFPDEPSSHEYTRDWDSDGNGFMPQPDEGEVSLTVESINRAFKEWE
jgi:hypothetical protein